MEIYDIIKDFIKPELVILIPMLYIAGMGLKKTSILKDKFIPLTLGATSIILSGLYLFATTEITGSKEIAMALFTAITQGVLIAGASVYANQIYKQISK